MLDQARNGRTEAEREEPFAPPAVEPLPDDAGFLRTIARTVSNPYSAVPRSVYERPYLRRDWGAAATLHVADPDLLEEMLVRRPADFPKSQIDHRVFRPALGAGLLTAEGEDWRWKRRLAAPTFAPSALARHASAMAAPFAALAEGWAQDASASRAEVDVDKAMVAATLEVIERILFSGPSELDGALIAREIDAMLRPVSWVVVLTLLGLPEWTPYPGRRVRRRAAQRMRAEVGKVVARRRAALAANKPSPPDLTASLLAARDPETGRPLSDEDMIDMLLTLVAAGHETSAHTLSWALYCLAHQPRLQDALAREAGEAQAAADGKALDPGALPQTEAAVKETLRLFPVAPMMGRFAPKATRLGEIDLPAGSICVVPIYALHRHRRHWEQPERFDISRFIDKPDPPRTLYMPFGAGPRVCVGARLAMMEMTLGLAALLSRVRVEPCARTECDPLHALTLRPRDGLWLKVSPRG